MSWFYVAPFTPFRVLGGVKPLAWPYPILQNFKHSVASCFGALNCSAVCPVEESTPIESCQTPETRPSAFYVQLADCPPFLVLFPAHFPLLAHVSWPVLVLVTGDRGHEHPVRLLKMITLKTLARLHKTNVRYWGVKIFHYKHTYSLDQNNSTKDAFRKGKI